MVGPNMKKAQEKLYERTNRIEAANALTNAIIDVINEHVRRHGRHDPLLYKILYAALMGVIEEISDRMYPEFARLLAANLEDYDPDFKDVEDF